MQFSKWHNWPKNHANVAQKIKPELYSPEEYSLSNALIKESSSHLPSSKGVSSLDPSLFDTFCVGDLDFRFRPAKDSADLALRPMGIREDDEGSSSYDSDRLQTS